MTLKIIALTQILIHFSVSGTKISSPLTTHSNPIKEDYPNNSPDSFVAESSISIAAICSDGVIMVTLHDTKSELLLHPRKIFSHRKQMFQDLPESSRVSLRIEAIDSYGSAMVTSGWKTDCNMLAATVREFASMHNEKFNFQESCAKNQSGISAQTYGKLIAHLSAHWLATCSFSQKARGMHCVGLLGMSSHDHICEGYLWLIDSTGAYPVRAHAIGIGARHINRRLMSINFKSLKHEDAIASILSILRDEAYIVENCDLLYVEIALVQSFTLKRKRGCITESN